eukprot:gene20874-22926_t
MATFSDLGKATKRGYGACAACSKQYANAHKPQCCSCGHFLGGKFKGEAKKKKVNSAPLSVTIFQANSSGVSTQLCSVRTTNKGNRTFVLESSNRGERICYNQQCKNVRSSYVNSQKSDEFTCKHLDAAAVDPVYKIGQFLENEIDNCTPDKGMSTTMKAVQKQFADLPTVVKVSEKNYVTKGTVSSSDLLGYVHVTVDEECKFACFAEPCKKTTHRTKQVGRRATCIHKHFVILARKLFEENVDEAQRCELGESSDVNVPRTVEEDLEHLTKFASGPGHASTLRLQMLLEIPYNIPANIIESGDKVISRCSSTKVVFEPNYLECKLCNAGLSKSLLPQGSNADCWLLTQIHPLHPIEIRTKRCTNTAWKALHSIFPYDQGLFNVCNKILVSISIFLEWREFLKEGVPVTNMIEAKLRALLMKKDKTLHPSKDEWKYIVGLLYNGFYGFEAMTKRDLNSVICGICGIVGEVYFGDGNEKNCCTLNEIDYKNMKQQQQQKSHTEEQSHHLEDMLKRIQLHMIEKATFAHPLLAYRVRAIEIPPIIAPEQRKFEMNTEAEKQSVYLKDDTHKKGDAILLAKFIKDFEINMSIIDEMAKEKIMEMAKYCKLSTSNKSTDFLRGEIQELHASIVVGTSACHGFTRTPGHTGGFYHFVCRHGVTVASKFLILTESVRDAADIYLLLKHQPITFVCDTACTFVRHMNNRVPSVTHHLWGQYDGSFEVPDPKKPAATDNNDQLNVTYINVKRRNTYSIVENKTFYKRTTKHEENEEGPALLFAECVLSIKGYLVDDQQEGQNKRIKNHWVFSCTGISNQLALVTKTIVLSYDAFLGHVRFAHALEAGFGAGLVVNGSLTKADLSDYLVFLKEDQLANNANKLFRVANHTGYMGDNYWFLSKEIQIQGGALLPANEVKYLTKPGHQLSNSFLAIAEELFDKSICLEINGRILHLSKSFNQNQANLLLAMSFTMARLLRLSMCSSEEQQNGEANVLLLHGPKNVGKTLTQHVVHFGQGGLDLCHNLLLSGGNQTTSGTSTIQIMECAKKCNFVMQLNDVTNSKLLGESLLQIHEKLQQGSLKRGLNSPMVIGILMSANTKEPTRLKGRVMRVEYHRSHQSMADEEKLVELKAICTRYKGFLTSWVIHHGELWLAMHHHVVPNVSCILQQCLPRKQKRWCNGMAVVLCTHALYLVTLKEDGMLAHHLLNVIQSQDEESMEEKTLVEKLEENIIRKIQANETHIFTWLNWHFKVQCLSTKTRVCAIAIKSGIVTEEFTDISSHELHTYLEDQVKNGWSVSVTFAKDSDGCTPIELSQRANNTTSTRAHKIPIRVFSKDMEKWLEFGLNGGEKPEENRKTTFEQLSDEQMAQIEKIDDTIKQKFQEMNENPNATADNDTDNLLDIISPKRRKLIESMTPRRRKAFYEGLQYGLQKQLHNREDIDAVGEIDEEDFCQSTPRRQLSFPNETIGVFPCGSSMSRASGCQGQVEDVVNESTSEDEAIGIVLPLPMVTSTPADESVKRKRSIYCICKQKKSPEEENEMVKCESRRKDCPGKGYYHLGCLNMDTLPDFSPWRCSHCTKAYRPRKKTARKSDSPGCLN